MRSVRLLLLAACIWTPAFTQSPAPQDSPGSVSRSKILPAFSIGEKLAFSVKWDPPWYLFFLPAMEAGQAELQLGEEVEHKGKKARKITFTARSSGRLMMLANMKIEDEFIFLSEPETYCALSAYQKIREGKRKRQIDVDYLRDTRQLHIRVLDESITPPKVNRDEIKDNVPPCVYDPFSALYLFRTSDLRLQYVQTYLIANDDKFKEVRAHIDRQEMLDTALGKLSAWSINTTALKDGLFREGGQFRIWFSADERKLPLQFEAKVSLGRVLGKLISVRH